MKMMTEGVMCSLIFTQNIFKARVQYNLKVFFATLGIVAGTLMGALADDTVSLNIPFESMRYLDDVGLTSALSASLTSQGEENIILKPNVANLKRLLLKNEDLTTVEVQLKVIDTMGDLAAGKLKIFRLLRNVNVAQQLICGTDYQAEPIAEISTEGIDIGQWVQFDGVEQVVQGWLGGAFEQYGLLIRFEGSEPAQITFFLNSPYSNPQDHLTGEQALNLPRMMVESHSYPKHDLFNYNGPVPKEGVYVEVKDGHFYYDNKRLRLWGVSRQRAPYTEKVIPRLKAMGFNAIRGWWPWDIYTDYSVKRNLSPVAAVKGDGGAWDQLDRRIVECRSNGIFMVMGALHNNPLGSYREHKEALLSEDSFLAFGDDWADWKQGIEDGFSFDKAVFFDERMQTLQKMHASNVLTHVNLYTGKKLADEEAVAIWEIFNENLFIKRTVDEGFSEWPDYFRNKLQVRWNQWLDSRYGDDGGLIAAWGELDSGETLTNDLVRLAPIFSEKDDYPEMRGNDFVRFLIELVNAWQKEFQTYCRGFSAPGEGISILPFWADTQYKHSTPVLYTSTQSDVQSFGMYYWGLSSTLTADPAMHIIDSTSVEGKPMVMYETNVSRPNPYRAEYPWRLVALASLQDWDGIFWHYWDKPEVPYVLSDEQYLVTQMSQIYERHCWYGLHHETDPVMCSSLAMAGRVFLNGLIKSAVNPVLFHVPAGKIFGYDGWQGISQKKEAFKYGSHIVLEPNRPGNEIIIEKNNPVADEQIDWDWKNGRMIIDTPTVKAYVGKTCSRYRFKGGITLSDVSQPFIVFMMVSADSKPLVGDDSSDKIYISAVKDAQNSGFKMDWSIALPHGGFIAPLTQQEAIKNVGHAPVISDRVSYRVSFPARLNYKFYGYDLAMRECKTFEIRDDTDLDYTGDEIFLGVMEISDRGRSFDVPYITDGSDVPGGGASSMGMIKKKKPNEQSVPFQDSRLIYCPLDDISWGLSYDEVYQLLENSNLKFESISPRDASGREQKTVRVSGEKVCFDSSGNVDVFFDHSGIRKIVFSLDNQPPISELVDFYNKHFGLPKTSHISSEAFEASKVIWSKTYEAEKRQLSIMIIEVQGTGQIIFELSDILTN